MNAEAKKFQKIHIEISNICNLQCSFCPPVERKNKVMEEDLFRKIVRENKHLTEDFCFHVMGEPLGHPKFKRFIEICEEESARIFLVTNGTLLNEDLYEPLLNPALRQINFSLQSFFANFPGKNPKNYLEKIFQFTTLAFKKRPDLYINYRMWNLNKTNAQNEINESILASIESFFSVSIERNIDIKKNKSKKVLNRLYMHYDTEFEWPNDKKSERSNTGYCHALSSHVAILAEGSVVPCCLDKEANLKLGSVEEKNLEQILAEPKATAMRRGFEQRKLVENFCKKCTYIQRFDA